MRLGPTHHSTGRSACRRRAGEFYDSNLVDAEKSFIYLKYIAIAYK
jgi:hypothetical protein